MKFYPYEKGVGAEKVLAMLKGGHKKFGVVFMRWLEVLAILKVGHNKFYPVLSGCTHKVSDPGFYHLLVPLPLNNDQSLTGMCGLKLEGNGFFWGMEGGEPCPPIWVYF